MTNFKISRSVRARWTAIKEASKSPVNAPEKLVAACKTQEALAALDLPEKNISSLSLNTLKSTADLVIEDGGWKKLDAGRKGVFSFSRITTGEKKQKRRKPALQNARDDVVVLKGKLTDERRARLVLLRAYLDLLNIVRPLTDENETLRTQLRRHESTWDIRALHSVDEKRGDGDG